MFCIHCGQTLPEDALFCSKCGRKTEDQAEASGSPPASAKTAKPAAEDNKKIDCGLALAIIALVLGNVFGTVALIYSVIAMDKLRNGNLKGARKAALTSKIWSWSVIISFAIVVAFALLVLPYAVEQFKAVLTVIEEASSI